MLAFKKSLVNNKYPPPYCYTSFVSDMYFALKAKNITLKDNNFPYNNKLTEICAITSVKYNVNTS